MKKILRSVLRQRATSAESDCTGRNLVHSFVSQGRKTEFRRVRRTVTFEEEGRVRRRGIRGQQRETDEYRCGASRRVRRQGELVPEVGRGEHAGAEVDRH